MKKHILLGSVVLGGLLLTACDRSATTAEDKNPANQTAESASNIPKNTETELPAVWAKPYKMNLVNPKICQPATLEDNAGCTIYDIQSIKTNIPWINQYYDVNLKKMYKDAFGIKQNVEIPPSEDNYQYYVGAMVSLKSQRYNLVTFSQFDNSYSGGAHNQYNVNYDMLDLKTQKRISLNDILLPNSKGKLIALAKQYNANELQEYGTDLAELQVSENFYLAENGLMLVYSPYEIAPWVFGMPELFIPYDELKGLIKDEYIPEQPDDSLSREFS